jgi:hypothetical protein
LKGQKKKQPQTAAELFERKWNLRKFISFEMNYGGEVMVGRGVGKGQKKKPRR